MQADCEVLQGADQIIRERGEGHRALEPVGQIADTE